MAKFCCFFDYIPNTKNDENWKHSWKQYVYNRNNVTESLLLRHLSFERDAKKKLFDSRFQLIRIQDPDTELYNTHSNRCS